MGIRIAITGTGFISRVHAQAVQNIPSIELVAVVNHRSESMADFAQAYQIPRRYANVEELLNDGQIEALVVGTPNFLHAPQAITALNAGVHVLVEKPMAMNTQEADHMLTASQRSGALLMVAHCWRFDPEVNWLREQVANGKVGSVIRTKGYGVHTDWGPGNWFTKRKFAGGGAVVDMGIHALDTARYLLGDPEPESVYARIGTYYRDRRSSSVGPGQPEYNVDDTGIILVNWQGGAVSYIESGWWQYHSDGPEAATQIYGTKGFGQLFPTHLKLGGGIRVDPGFSYPRQPHAPQSMYDAQMRYFVDCIQNRQIPNPGGKEGLTNIRILEAAYESSRGGEIVRL